MAVTSAGLLMFRRTPGIEVLIVHPGGPFWQNKDLGAWSLPKGQVNSGEDLLAAARREFAEELGFAAPDGPAIALGSVRLKSGKVVHAWAVEGDCDPATCASNTMRMEWPARSGKWITIPEVDRAEFVSPGVAKEKLDAAQAAFVDRLVEAVGEGKRET